MITREIVDRDCQIVTLLPPKASPHTFEATPAVVTSLLKSRLLIIVGSGLESWLQSAIERYKEKEDSKILVLTEGMELINLPNSSKPNPHIWLSVKSMKRAARKINQAVSALYPEKSADFAQRTNAFVTRLDSLDTELQEMFAPLKGESFFSFEPAWSYFVQDYGLKEVGYLTHNPAMQQGASDIGKVLKRLETKEIHTVFAQKQAPQSYVGSLAEEYNLKVIYLDPIGNPSDSCTDSYIELIRYNAERIAKGLRE